jgi:hypothetical protein
MPVAFQVLRWSLGSLAFYAAAFVREDEEGAIQNLLEMWWIRLMYARDSALSGATTFMGGIARLANRGFDTIFGKRLLSLHAIGVSVWFSLAVFSLFALFAVYFRRPVAWPTGWHAFGAWVQVSVPLIVFTLLGVLPSLIGRAAFWVWAVCLVIFTSIVVLVMYRAVGSTSTLRGIGITFLGFAGSFASDVLYISVTRWMLRRTSEMKRLYEIIGIIVLDCLLAVVLVFLPAVLGGLLIELTSLPMVGSPFMLAVMFNLGDIVACSVFFVLMVLMLAHRLLWPILERPIYAVQRFGMIRRKALLWSIGGALWFGPKGVELAKYVIQHV